MSFADTFKINLTDNSSSFTDQFGSGTIGENQNNQNQNNNKSSASDIITASAGGLDSITGFVSLLSGQPQQTQTYTEPAPAPKSKVNPMVIGGIIGGSILLIALLIFLKNGKSK